MSRPRQNGLFRDRSRQCMWDGSKILLDRSSVHLNFGGSNNQLLILTLCLPRQVDPRHAPATVAQLAPEGRLARDIAGQTDRTCIKAGLYGDGAAFSFVVNWLYLDMLGQRLFAAFVNRAH